MNCLLNTLYKIQNTVGAALVGVPNSVRSRRVYQEKEVRSCKILTRAPVQTHPLNKLGVA